MAESAVPARILVLDPNPGFADEPPRTSTPSGDWSAHQAMRA